MSLACPGPDISREAHEIYDLFCSDDTVFDRCVELHPSFDIVFMSFFSHKKEMLLLFDHDCGYIASGNMDRYKEKISVTTKKVQTEQVLNRYVSSFVFAFQKVTKKYLPLHCVEFILSYLKKDCMKIYTPKSSGFALFNFEQNYLFLRVGMNYRIVPSRFKGFKYDFDLVYGDGCEYRRIFSTSSERDLVMVIQKITLEKQ